MQKFCMQIKGKNLVFTNTALFLAGNEFLYSKMSNIAHRSGDNPAFIFGYDGKRLALPYEQKDKNDLIKIFRQISLMNQNKDSEIVLPERIAAVESSDIFISPPGSKKRLLYSVLKIILICFTAFGILGIILMLTETDVPGFIFYVIWALIGGLLLFLVFRKSKSFDELKRPVGKKSNVSENFTPQSKPTMEPQKSDCNDIFPAPPSQPIAPELPHPELTFPDTYIALDFETPNRNNDRISQIGLLLVQNGKIEENYSTLIKPEVRFDPINTALTSLNSSTVAHAPTFDEYWPHIKQLFESYVTVAHNANFDLTVLYKTLSHYEIEMPKIKYVCTYVESINKLPELEDYSLSTLAEHFNITQKNSHNAFYDADICRLIFESMKTEKYQFIISEFKEPASSMSADETTFVDHKKDDVVIDINIPFSNCSQIEIDDKRFVLTGVFTITTKQDIEKYVEQNHGRVTGSVSGKTDYLIVGSEIEPAWKHGNYGRKIEKALELIDSGKSNIKIIKEEDAVNTYRLSES